jgi:septum formation protein
MGKLLFPENLVLASQSPRRKYLLEQAGFSIRVLHVEVEENYPIDLDSQQVAEYLAVKKGAAAKEFISKDETCITADTVVILDGAILGKPKTKKEAIDMLHSLSNRTHSVITGVCLSGKDSQHSFSVHSIVSCGSISDSEIEYYIENYKPYDKAGSYGIQEWFGWCKIDRIEGSYSNIMGLPMHELFEQLMGLGKLS